MEQKIQAPPLTPPSQRKSTGDQQEALEKAMTEMSSKSSSSVETFSVTSPSDHNNASSPMEIASEYDDTESTECTVEPSVDSKRSKKKTKKISIKDLKLALKRKVVESVVYQGELQKLRVEADTARKKQAELKEQIEMLHKSLKDLTLVHNEYLAQVSSCQDVNKKFVPPVKVVRSVGIQVCPVDERMRLKQLAQLSGVSKLSDTLSETRKFTHFHKTSSIYYYNLAIVF